MCTYSPDLNPRPLYAHVRSRQTWPAPICVRALWMATHYINKRGIGRVTQLRAYVDSKLRGRTWFNKMI